MKTKIKLNEECKLCVQFAYSIKPKAMEHATISFGFLFSLELD